jgi:hypothetical protein
VDDVASEEAVASAVTEDKLMDAELAEDELDIEKQLEAEANKLVDDDDGKTVDSKPAAAETAEEEEEESQGLSAREARLIARMERLEAENAQLKGAQEEPEPEDETPDDIPYDAGTIGEEFEGLRPALEANGKFLISQVRAAEKKSLRIMQQAMSRVDEMEAEMTRMRFNISADEETEIVDFAKKNGMSYGTRAELARLVKSFRDDKELRDLRREKAERETAGKNAKPERKANTRTRNTSRQVEEELQEAIDGDRYNASWDRAVKSTLGSLRKGGGILGGRGL